MMTTAAAAAVTAAAVIAAGMLLPVVVIVVIVVIAADIGIEVQRTGQEQGNCLIGISPDTAVKLDAGLVQRHLGTAADTAADQNIGMKTAQQICQCAMTAAHGINDLGGNDLAVFHIIDLELGTVAKMLENITAFVSNCNSHDESLLLN